MPEQAIWAAIRRDREEHGLSLRTLALKYGISKSYIGTVLSGVSSGQSGQEKQPQTLPSLRTPPTPTENAQSQSLTAVIAHALIKKIAKQVLGDLDPKDMKLLADTLSQCNKIVVGEEIEGQEHSPYDIRAFLAKCTLEELVIIQPVMDAVAERDREKIIPIRRIS